MGKQYNKIEKRVRRQRYLERLKARAKIKPISTAKSRVRKPTTKKKKEETPAPAPAETAAATAETPAAE